MNDTKPKVIVRCDLCNWTNEHASPAQAGRNLAFHKSKIHGVKGQYATLEGKRMGARHRHWRIQGLNPRQIQEREAAFQAKHSSNGSVTAEPTEPRRKPAKVTEEIEMVFICPKCQCRVYVASH